VTDHRVNLTKHNIEAVLAGGEELDEILEALRGAAAAEALAALEEDASREAAAKAKADKAAGGKGKA
jgi:hypothetical protein